MMLTGPRLLSLSSCLPPFFPETFNYFNHDYNQFQPERQKSDHQILADIFS